MSIDADIAAAEDLFGKTVSDLQSGITVGSKAISGTLKYVADYSSAYGAGEDSGNYIVLHAEVPDTEDVTITVEVVNGVHGPQTLDEDGIAICRITDKNSQKIRFVARKTGCEPVTKTFTLRGLTLKSS